MTVQTGKNCTASSIIKGIESVINLYKARGFNVNTIHGDNKFDIECLKSAITPTVTQIYGKDKHVDSVERSIQTVKDRTRSICHGLPYQYYTKLMINSLVEYTIYWINVFPSRSGASKTMSPSNIILGRARPNFNYSHIEYGAYAMVFLGTANNMSA